VDRPDHVGFLGEVEGPTQGRERQLRGQEILDLDLIAGARLWCLGHIVHRKGDSMGMDVASQRLPRSRSGARIVGGR
jgi:hypothetical protein